MTSGAIGARAIGDAGRISLTVDFGRTRLAEELDVRGEPRTGEAGRDGAAIARRSAAAAATRP